MTRFATPIILASVPATGWTKTPSEAREQPPADAQPPATASLLAQLREKAGDGGAQPAPPAPVAEEKPATPKP
jgi:hypothetical protein